MNYNNFFNKFKAYICMKIGKLDKEQGVIIARNLYAKKLYKMYSSYFVDESCENLVSIENKTVWVCWFQGFDNAPEIVKLCIKSIYDHFKDFNIIFLDNNNIHDYVKLPNYIEELHAKKIICSAHYSDLIRLYLLINYGGLWIDASVFCTDLLNDDFFSFSFFAFSHVGQHDNSISVGNWFMWSYTNNLILRSTYNFLLNFWKKGKRTKDYFIFQIFYSLSEKLYNSYFNSLFYSDLQPHALFGILGKEYNENNFRFYISKTNFHKFTYKINFENDKNSLYNFLTNKYSKGEFIK